MNTLLIMSFMLHIITLAAIYLLYSHIKTFKKDTPKDVLDLLDLYLKEIKLENEHLKQQLDKTKPNTVSHASQEEQRPDSSYQEQPSSYEADKLISDMIDTYEHSLESQILQLHNEGYHPDEIARRLNCGKTEAELVIKMQTDK